MEVVKIERRPDGVAIAWLANGQMNSISPQVIEDLGKVWQQVKDSSGQGGAAPVHALVIASSNPFLFSAGADIKAFTSMDASSGEQLIHAAHALFRELGSEGIATIAAVNGLAFGGGCELAMACDVRIAARSATFGQPEIKLGIIPGFGGTQRLPRLVGENKALEMNLVGDPILAEEAFELGLVNRMVEDHELLDTALGLGAQACRPGAGRFGADQACFGRRATSTRASRPRSAASRRRSRARTPRRASPPSSASARRAFKVAEPVQIAERAPLPDAQGSPNWLEAPSARRQEAAFELHPNLPDGSS